MSRLVTMTLSVFLFISACSDAGNDPEQQGHAWKDQTETLDKAKAVEGLVQDAAAGRSRQLQDDTE